MTLGSIWLQELFQAPLCFLRSFCYARLRLDPLGGQVLHHDCISMIVSRFTTFTKNFVIGCNQINKIFCTKYDCANASSARGPCYSGPLADLEISVFREVSINTVLTPNSSTETVASSCVCTSPLVFFLTQNWLLYPSLDFRRRQSFQFSGIQILIMCIDAHRIGFRMFELFHKIDEDFGGSIS